MDDWGRPGWGGGEGGEKKKGLNEVGVREGGKENKKLDVAGWIPVNHLIGMGGRQGRANWKGWEAGPVSPGEQNVSDNKMGDLLWRNKMCCFPLPGVSKALGLTGECRLQLAGLFRNITAALRQNVYWLWINYLLAPTPKDKWIPHSLDNSIVICKKNEHLPGG